MSRRQQIRMTDEEVADFLAAGRTLQVATIGPDGAPHLVPMWYAPLDGRLAFWTYAKSQKAVNLRRDPRITCLVEAGERYEELRGVLIRGRAEVVEDAQVVQRVGELIYERHRGPLTDEARAGVAWEGRKRVAVIVEAERIVSWDHRK
jgi:PPOX class probable F420-dependent enzyme